MIHNNYKLKITGKVTHINEVIQNLEYPYSVCTNRGDLLLIGCDDNKNIIATNLMNGTTTSFPIEVHLAHLRNGYLALVEAAIQI